MSRWTKTMRNPYRRINNNIWDLNRMLKETEAVQAGPGGCCTSPCECWYYAYCHGDMSVGGES